MHCASFLCNLLCYVPHDKDSIREGMNSYVFLPVTLYNVVNAQGYSERYIKEYSHNLGTYGHQNYKELSVLVNLKMTICYYCREMSVLLVCSNSACSVTIPQSRLHLFPCHSLKWQRVLIQKKQTVSTRSFNFI